MNNLNVLITGSIGSGKSSLARLMLERSRRAVVLDPQLEYESGAIADRFAPAIDWYSRHMESGRFRLICRFRSVEENLSMLEAIRYGKELEADQGSDLQQLSLFIEEIHRFTSTQSIEDELQKLYLFARHYRTNIVAVVQSDVDVHRVVRQNSHIVVAFRQMKLTTDMQRRFPGMHDRLASLEPFNPTRYDRPVPGQHYVTYPHDVDVLDAWEIASSGESFELSGFMDVDSSEDIGEDVPLVEHEKGEPSSLSPDDGSPIAAGAEDDGSPSS